MVSDRTRTSTYAARMARPGDVVMLMEAGDVDESGSELLASGRFCSHRGPPRFGYFAMTDDPGTAACKSEGARVINALRWSDEVRPAVQVAPVPAEVDEGAMPPLPGPIDATSVEIPDLTNTYAQVLAQVVEAKPPAREFAGSTGLVRRPHLVDLMDELSSRSTRFMPSTGRAKSPTPDRNWVVNWFADLCGLPRLRAIGSNHPTPSRAKERKLLPATDPFPRTRHHAAADAAPAVMLCVLTR